MRRKGILVIVVVLLVAVVVLGYIYTIHGNRTYVTAIDTTQDSHFHILFHRHGGVTFRQHSERVRVYLAHYNQEELVLHELVASIETVGAYTFNGSFIWGITTERGQATELRTKLVRNGAMSLNYTDLSNLGFDITTASTAGFSALTSPLLSQEGRYVLHLWQSGLSFRTDGNVFYPEQLRNSEHTVILYLVFE